MTDLGRVLRGLRRRHARQHGSAELTYRELAARTGWSHGIIGEYLAGRVLPPTDRFDVLIRLLGASPAEQGALATARDRVEEGRRGTPALPVGVPRQLPAVPFGFAGRLDQLALLDAWLAGDTHAPAVVISAVSGSAGVGKTALAVLWAHRVAERFPHGQLYLDLRGYDPRSPVPPGEALGRFLRGLGVPAADVPGELDERAALYRTLVAGRRMLVLIDNAASADQVRPLLPGTPTCLVVVTSRDRLAGLVAREGARRLDLDVLHESESLAVLRAVIGERVDADLAAAARLARLCDQLPLALRIAAEIAAAHPATSLAELASDLHDEGRRLDQLSANGDARTAVRAAFTWSYRNLTPGAARAFGLLGQHPGRDVDRYDVAALLDTDADADADLAAAAIDELAQAHLLEPRDGGRFAMHDLLRVYAGECLPPDPAAVTRLFDHYVHTTVRAAATLFPHDQQPEVAAPASREPAMGDRDTAQTWLDHHRANLVAIAQHTARHSPRHSVDLSRALWRYFEVGGHYQEALDVHGSAEAAASGDAAGGLDLPSALTNLGNVRWWLGDYRDALALFERALTGHRQAGNQDGAARALARLGVVHERLGDQGLALLRLEEALALYRALGDRHGEGVQLVNLGALHRRYGRPAQAASIHEGAVRIFAEVGDRRLEGYALGNLGADYGLLARHADALDLLARARALCQDAADPAGAASAMAAAGSVYRQLGQFELALSHLHEALDVSRVTADRGLETDALNGLGETLRAMGDPAAARLRHLEALTLARRTGDPFEQARALAGIAPDDQLGAAPGASDPSSAAR